MNKTDANNLLRKHGICERCGELYDGCYDSPHASCGCTGSSEWYTETPHMSAVNSLRRENQRLVGELYETEEKIKTMNKNKAKYLILGSDSVIGTVFEHPEHGRTIVVESEIKTRLGDNTKFSLWDFEKEKHIDVGDLLDFFQSMLTRQD